METTNNQAWTRKSKPVFYLILGNFVIQEFLCILACVIYDLELKDWFACTNIVEIRGIYICLSGLGQL